MVRGELLSSNDQCFAAFLADQDDRDLSDSITNVKENTAFGESDTVQVECFRPIL
jgi:hypothetical protein